MGIRQIRVNDDPILRKVSRPVESFDAKLFKLLDDMRDTLYDADGCGLAAVQVGMLKRVVVIDVGDGLIELINPEIVESDGVQYEIEGCLSLPGKSGVTVRPKTVKVRAQNREGNGAFIRARTLKRAFCHEIDHLDGHLYIERLAPEEVVERIRRESGRID